MSQNTLLKTDDAQVQIETTADVIKPIFGYARKHVDEAKVHFNSDGIHYKVVDPSNVSMATLDAPAGVFESYHADETTVGMPFKQTMRALRAGRKRQGDSITLEYSDMQLSTTVNREYDGTEMDLQNNYQTIDPDSIRQEPKIQDIEFDVSATLDRNLFEDVVDAVDEISDHIRFEDNAGDLVISGESDVSDARAIVRGVVNGEGVDSIFSLDYIAKNLVKSLKTVGVDEFEIELGEEFPMRVNWTKDINDETIEGTYFIAPRIQG